ncbi:hypothetical protein CXG81DRAFT_12736 [Caulochytrium protostelioides]|uniref:Large ribosomal subunit protein uL11m n=1 Tax=Caulochytrium protostelioides TaxID=1555241 RepID=A0A4P9X724_9FUNG|nr:hypothetical protein CXG81DRAFT_12736 [Caulochytrium protostelioides]|eukprot:RKP00840.1 hypothetical protein CXG81DRAFT_12736 [Caulochytrium protostelioides]
MSKAAASTTTHLIRLLVPAGKAAPTPPVGPALGQRGIKSMDFCKSFNARTAHYLPGVPLPTKIRVQPDKSYDYRVTAPQAAYLLMQAAGITQGAKNPGSEVVATLSLKHIYEIAKIKQADPAFEHQPLRKVASSILGQAKSMGIEVTY